MPKIAAVPLRDDGRAELAVDDDIAAAIAPNPPKPPPKRTPAQQRAMDQAEVAHLAFLDAQAAYEVASDERARAFWNATRSAWTATEIAARCSAHGIPVTQPTVTMSIRRWRSKLRRERTKKKAR